jgi:hypothetical protein
MMTSADDEIYIPVFGNVLSRPVGTPGAEWQLVAETPGGFTPRPGEDYQFEFMGISDVRDPDLEQLADALAGARAVKSVVLGGCDVSARAIRRLAALPWIEGLDAYRMTDEGLATVSRLTELRRLHLDASDVSDAGVAKLAGLVKLEELSLHACPITDAAVEALSELPALATVTLDGCRALTDRTARALAAMPALHSIGLVGCWRLTDHGLAALAAMPKLTYLGICRSSGFFGRLLRRCGVPGNAETAAFSEAGVRRIWDAHPDCNLWQPIDSSALRG